LTEPLTEPSGIFRQLAQYCCAKSHVYRAFDRAMIACRHWFADDLLRIASTPQLED
jgi:hypothetical protein